MDSNIPAQYACNLTKNVSRVSRFLLGGAWTARKYWIFTVGLIVAQTILVLGYGNLRLSGRKQADS